MQKVTRRKHLVDEIHASLRPTIYFNNSKVASCAFGFYTWVSSSFANGMLLSRCIHVDEMVTCDLRAPRVVNWSPGCMLYTRALSLSPGGRQLDLLPSNALLCQTWQMFKTFGKILHFWIPMRVIKCQQFVIPSRSPITMSHFWGKNTEYIVTPHQTITLDSNQKALDVFSSGSDCDTLKLWLVCPEGCSAGGSALCSGPAGAMAGGPARVSSHTLLAFLAGCVMFKIYE